MAKDECDSLGPPIPCKMIDPGGPVSEYCKERSARAAYQEDNSQGNMMEQENPQIRNGDVLRPDGSKGMFVPYDVSAQRITQDHLRRDKDLWTLLQSTYGPTLLEDNSGISVGSDSVGGDSRSKSEEDSMKMSDEQVSVLSLNCSQSGDRNESASYKFKHNITQRFSQEKQVQQSDTSSSSSQENDHEKLKRKFRHGKCRQEMYPNSDSSNGNGSGDSSNGSTGDFKISLLPGFVLHPTGTHYVPLSIHPSHMGNNFFNSKAASNAPNVYHPISIPVNFGGPLLSMRKISIRSNHKSAEVIDSGLSGLSSNSNSPCGALSSGTPSLTSEL